MALSDNLAPSTHSIVNTSRDVSSAYTLHPEINSQSTPPIPAKRSDARAKRTGAMHNAQCTSEVGGMQVWRGRRLRMNYEANTPEAASEEPATIGRKI